MLCGTHHFYFIFQSLCSSSANLFFNNLYLKNYQNHYYKAIEQNQSTILQNNFTSVQLFNKSYSTGFAIRKNFQKLPIQQLATQKKISIQNKPLLGSVNPRYTPPASYLTLCITHHPSTLAETERKSSSSSSSSPEG